MRSKGAAKRPRLHSQREINLSYFVTPKDNVEKKTNHHFHKLYVFTEQNVQWTFIVKESIKNWFVSVHFIA